MVLSPGEHSYLKMPRHWAFQEPYCVARETEARGRGRSHLSSSAALSSVPPCLSSQPWPYGPSQPVMDQLSDPGATLALSGPLSLSLSPLPTEGQGKPSGQQQHMWGGFLLPHAYWTASPTSYWTFQNHTQARLDTRLPFLSSIRLAQQPCKGNPITALIAQRKKPRSGATPPQC